PTVVYATPGPGAKASVPFRARRCTLSNRILRKADRHIPRIPGIYRETTIRDAGKGVPCSFLSVPCRARWWRAEPCFRLPETSWGAGNLRSSGKRGLAIENEHVL